MLTGLFFCSDDDFFFCGIFFLKKKKNLKDHHNQLKTQTMNTTAAKQNNKSPEWWFASIIKPNLHDVLDDGKLRALAQVEDETDFCSVRLFLSEYYIPQQTTVFEFLAYQMFFHQDVVIYVNKCILKKIVKKNPGGVPLTDPVYTAETDYTHYWRTTHNKNDNEDEMTDEQWDPTFDERKRVTWQLVASKLAKIQNNDI